MEITNAEPTLRNNAAGFRSKGALMKILYPPMKWIHLGFAAIVLMGMIIYLGHHFTKSDDTVPPTGTAILIILCLMSAANLVFDILLIRGIVKVWTFSLVLYVMINHILACATIILSLDNISEEIRNGVTFGDFIKHFLLYCIIIIAALYLFRPAFEFQKMSRAKRQQANQYGKESQLLSTLDEAKSGIKDKDLKDIENGEDVGDAAGNAENAGDFEGDADAASL